MDNNIVTLSKSSYDSMRGTNDRASMLLNRILATITIENDSDTLHINEQTVLVVLEILYPDTYKKKKKKGFCTENASCKEFSERS